jgi:hypothetical protein
MPCSPGVEPARMQRACLLGAASFVRSQGALGHSLDMTPQQAEDGCMELDLPDGGRVLVRFSEDLSANPEIEAEVVQMMLAATGNAAEVRAAIADYAAASGLTAVVSVDRGALAVSIR